MNFIPHTEADYKTANSYLSVAEADDLISGQKGSETWEGYSNINIKENNLIIASMLISEAITFQGVKVSERSSVSIP